MGSTVYTNHWRTGPQADIRIQCCGAEQETDLGVTLCTREKNHCGPHVAHSWHAESAITSYVAWYADPNLELPKGF